LNKSEGFKLYFSYKAAQEVIFSFTKAPFWGEGFDKRKNNKED